MLSKNNKWFLLILLSLIWGSSFILIKRGLVGLNAFQVGSLRIIFTSIFLLLIGFKSLSKIPHIQWKYVAMTAFFGTFLPVYLFSYAQTQIHSSVSAILNSLTPMNTLILGILAFGLTFKRGQIIGVLIGLAGSILLVYNGAINNPNQNYFYAIFIVIASLCYATNVNLIKKYLSDLSPMSISVGNFAVLLIPALVVLSFSGFSEVVYLPKAQHSMLFVAVLGIVGTGIANLIFFRLIQISSPVFATSVTYLIPVVAFGWGLLDNEMLTPVQFLGAFIILVGVYMASRK
ncbi:DMT family transporter [Flavobacterium sp.]|uniref:DMT family transporter n=1 Tax=Flavobacterium sp. TaxID=239 RepID=UPI00286EB388|nr:DMT family transporter [Flavobacterium sp.]